MSSNKRNILSLVMMILITGITQVLTLAKSSIVAGYFGASSYADAYNFANSIVSFVFGFVSSAISTIIIPNYVKKEHTSETNTFITILYLLLASIIAIIIALRFKIVGVFTNREEAFVNIACNILLILLMANYLLAITNVTTAFYQSINKYNIPKIINLFVQICVVVILLAIPGLDIVQYAIVFAISAVINFAVDVFVAFKLGWKYKPHFNTKNPETRRLFHMFVPMIASTGVYQLSLMIDSTIASRLDEGMLTILSYSSQISGMINSILIGNLLIYCYPKIVKRIKDENNLHVFWNQAHFFHLVMCLIICGFTVVGKEAISILFEHGKFNSTATKYVFLCTLIYIAGQQSNVIRDLMYRYFYAIGDTKTPASNSILVSVINITSSLIFVKFFGVFGIALGTIVASFCSLLRMLIIFNFKIGFGILFKSLLGGFIKNIAISLLCIICVLLTKQFIPINNKVFGLLLFGTETLILFLSLALLIGKKQIRETIATL